MSPVPRCVMEDEAAREEAPCTPRGPRGDPSQDSQGRQEVACQPRTGTQHLQGEGLRYRSDPAVPCRPNSIELLKGTGYYW